MEIITDVTHIIEPKSRQSNSIPPETAKESQKLLTGPNNIKNHSNKENSEGVEHKEAAQVKLEDFLFDSSSAFDKRLTYPDPIKM